MFSTTFSESVVFLMDKHGGRLHRIGTPHLHRFLVFVQNVSSSENFHNFIGSPSLHDEPLDYVA